MYKGGLLLVGIILYYQWNTFIVCLWVWCSFIGVVWFFIQGDCATVKWVFDAPQHVCNCIVCRRATSIRTILCRQFFFACSHLIASIHHASNTSLEHSVWVAPDILSVCFAFHSRMPIRLYLVLLSVVHVCHYSNCRTYQGGMEHVHINGAHSM